MGKPPKKKQKRSAQKESNSHQGHQKVQSLDSRDDPRDEKMRNREPVDYVKEPEKQNYLTKGKPKLGQGKQELPQSRGSQFKTIDSHQHQEPVCKKTNKHNANNSSTVQNQPGCVSLIPGVGVSQVNPNKQVKSVTKGNQGTRSDGQTEIVHGLKSNTAQCNTSVVPSQKSKTEPCQTNVVHSPNIVSTAQNLTSMAASPKRNPVVQCKSSAITSPNMNLTQCKSSIASGTNEGDNTAKCQTSLVLVAKGNTAKCQTSVVPGTKKGTAAKCQTSVVPGAKKGSTAKCQTSVVSGTKKGSTAKYQTSVVSGTKKGSTAKYQTSVVSGTKKGSTAKYQTSELPDEKKGITTVPVVPLAKGNTAKCQTSVILGAKKDNTAKCLTSVVPNEKKESTAKGQTIEISGAKKANIIQNQPVTIPSPKKNSTLCQTSPVSGAMKGSTAKCQTSATKDGQGQTSITNDIERNDITGSLNSPETRLDGYQGNEPEGEGNIDKVKLPKKKRKRPVKRNRKFSQGDKLGSRESRLDEDKESEKTRFSDSDIDVKSVKDCNKISDVSMQNKSKNVQYQTSKVHPLKNTSTTPSLNSPEINADHIRDNEPGKEDKVDKVKCPKRKRKRKRPSKRNQKLGQGDQQKHYEDSREITFEQDENFKKKEIIDGRSGQEGNQTVVAASPKSVTAQCQTRVSTVAKKGSTIQCQTTTVPGLKDDMQCQTSNVTSNSDSDVDFDEGSDEDSDRDYDVDADTNCNTNSVDDVTFHNEEKGPFNSGFKSSSRSSASWWSGEVFDMYSGWDELFGHMAAQEWRQQSALRCKPVSTRNEYDQRAAGVSARATSKCEDHSGENRMKNSSILRPDSGQQYALPRPISTRSDETRLLGVQRGDLLALSKVAILGERARQQPVPFDYRMTRTRFLEEPENQSRTCLHDHLFKEVKYYTFNSEDICYTTEVREGPVPRYRQSLWIRDSERMYQSGTRKYGLSSRIEFLMRYDNTRQVGDLDLTNCYGCHAGSGMHDHHLPLKELMRRRRGLTSLTPYQMARICPLNFVCYAFGENGLLPHCEHIPESWLRRINLVEYTPIYLTPTPLIEEHSRIVQERDAESIVYCLCEFCLTVFCLCLAIFIVICYGIWSSQ